MVQLVDETSIRPPTDVMKPDKIDMDASTYRLKTETVSPVVLLTVQATVSGSTPPFGPRPPVERPF